jgi:branched-chain amino acid transport system ATP-binding protein
MNTPLLQTNSLSASFSGLAALTGLSLTIQKEKITALIGPNGAGKTTLFNLITGYISPTAGEVLFLGRTITREASYRIARLGMVRTFQDVRILRNLSVIDNVIMALRDKRHECLFSAIFLRKSIKYEEQQLREKALILLKEVELDTKANEPASNLSYGQAKLLEITRVRAMKPQLLLLDEPASGLNPVMLEEVKTLLLTMNREGISIFLIEHNMPFVFDIAESVIVLDRGMKIFEGTPAETMKSSKVIEAYIGKQTFAGLESPA